MRKRFDFIYTKIDLEVMTIIEDQ